MQAEKYNFTITKGETWSQIFQLADNPQQIQGSTNASPIVVTIAQHGYSNGQKVRIGGHNSNKAANGNWTVANVTPNTFELSGSTGSGTGYAQGVCAGAIDATGANITCQFRAERYAAAPTVTPTLTWLDRTTCRFSLSLTAVQTGALTGNSLVYDLWFVDTTGAETPRLAGTITLIDPVTR